MSTPALGVHDISVNYGAIPALRGASLRVEPGEIVAVVGPNGAGKTTLVRAIAGLERLVSGEVRLAGADVSRWAAEKRVAQGVAMVPQGRRVFAESTVRVNLWAGAYLRSDHAEVEADMQTYFEMFPILAERADVAAGVLSGGEQQMLALARALMGRPSILLLDEPSMGLAPIVVKRIFEALQVFRTEGTTMLLVEQNVARALEVADRVYVLRGGQVVASDLNASQVSVDDLVGQYLGV